MFIKVDVAGRDDGAPGHIHLYKDYNWDVLRFSFCFSRRYSAQTR
jgi:hypothetical protein